MSRGYFAIGVYYPKTEENIGTLWRSANIYGASYIFTIGRRYKKQSSDTLKTYRHIPLFHYDNYEEFRRNLPHDVQIVCLENNEGAVDLRTFNHPQRAIYLLGSEDNGLPDNILSGRKVICVPSEKDFCLNVSVAGSIVMYDRFYGKIMED